MAFPKLASSSASRFRPPSVCSSSRRPGTGCSICSSSTVGSRADRCGSAAGQGKKLGRHRPTTADSDDSDEPDELLQCLRQDPPDFAGLELQLQKKRCAINAADEAFGWPPLLFAAHAGSAKATKQLLQAAADIESTCRQGNAALHVAARSGHSAVTGLLISSGAELETRNENGWTPLCWAALSGHGNVASLLMEASAEMSAADAQGQTPCMWAARHGHAQIVRALLKRGIDLSLQDRGGLTVSDHAQANRNLRASLRQQRNRDTTLADAARQGDISRALEALQAGARPGARESGTTALHLALRRGSLEVVRLLVRHSSTESFDTDILAEALHHDPLLVEALADALRASQRLLAAAEVGSWSQAEEAISAGACVSTRDPSTLKSPLMFFAVHGDPEALVSLAIARAELEAKDLQGWTALHHAVYSGRLECVSALHYVGSDFSSQSYGGDTPHHLAAWADRGSLLQLLHAAEAGLNVQNAEGYTPLQAAACGGSVGAIRTLLALKANVRAKDHCERSVFALAVLHGHAAAAQALVGAAPPLRRIWPLDAASEDSGYNLMRLQPSVLQAIEEEPSVTATNGVAHAVRPNSSDSSVSLAASSSAPSIAPSATSSTTTKRRSKKRKSVNSVSSATRTRRASNTKAGAPTDASAGIEEDDRYSLLRAAGAYVGGGPIVAVQRRGKKNSAAPVANSKEGTTTDAPVSPLTANEAVSSVDLDGRSPLSFAAALTNAQELVQVVLEFKAQVDAADKSGTTALMVAARHAERQTVALLLEARASADGPRDMKGRCAIDLAGSPETRRMLEEQAKRDSIARAFQKEPALPSLPSLGSEKNKPRNDKCGLLRLDGLPRRINAFALEECIRELLRDRGLESPRSVDVEADPISLRSLGKCLIDVGTAAAAAKVAAKVDGAELLLGQVRALTVSTC